MYVITENGKLFTNQGILGPSQNHSQDDVGLSLTSFPDIGMIR